MRIRVNITLTGAENVFIQTRGWSGVLNRGTYYRMLYNISSVPVLLVDYAFEQDCNSICLSESGTRVEVEVCFFKS
jgi:hypothetical protein